MVFLSLRGRSHPCTDLVCPSCPPFPSQPFPCSSLQEDRMAFPLINVNTINICAKVGSCLYCRQVCLQKVRFFSNPQSQAFCMVSVFFSLYCEPSLSEIKVSVLAFLLLSSCHTNLWLFAEANFPFPSTRDYPFSLVGNWGFCWNKDGVYLRTDPHGPAWMVTLLSTEEDNMSVSLVDGWRLKCPYYFWVILEFSLSQMTNMMFPQCELGERNELSISCPKTISAPFPITKISHIPFKLVDSSLHPSVLNVHCFLHVSWIAYCSYWKLACDNWPWGQGTLSKLEELELGTALSWSPWEALRSWNRQAVNHCGDDKYEEREEKEAVEENRESLSVGWWGGVSKENLRKQEEWVQRRALEIKSQAGGGERAWQSAKAGWGMPSRKYSWDLAAEVQGQCQGPGVGVRGQGTWFRVGR